MKKILLTGGNGYIGSHTAIILSKKNYSVDILDNFHNSDPDYFHRIKSLCKNNINLIECDICDKNHINKVFNNNYYDAVIHFAALKYVPESQLYPEKYFNVNVTGTKNLIESCINNNVSNFIFSSTAAIYGELTKSPITESSPLNPINPYGESKLRAEGILIDKCKEFKNLSVIVLRYFNPIGAHESGIIGEEITTKSTNLIPAIVRSINEGKKFNIYGSDYPTYDGTCIRDFIHINDLAVAHLAALEFSFKNNDFSVFNVGTGIGISVLDVLKTYEKVTQKNIPYELMPRREGDPAELYSSCFRANNELKWIAKQNLFDMIKSDWNYRKSFFNN